MADASLASAPKRLAVAALLWFAAPPVGLYLLYLGRDHHAVVHVLTGGGLGVGWLRDGLQLRRYVRLANEAGTSEASAALGWARPLGMLALGYACGIVAAHLVPAPGTSASMLRFLENPHTMEAAQWWAGLTARHAWLQPTLAAGMQAAGAAAGAAAVGTVPRSATTALRSSAGSTLLGGAAGCALVPLARRGCAALQAAALLPRALSHLLPLGALPAVGALLGFAARARLQTGRRPRRQAAGLLRRLACVAACVGGANVAQQAAFALHGEHSLEGHAFAEPAHPLLRSPWWWAEARATAWALVRDELPAHGARHALRLALDLLDLSGEERARRVLGLAADASAAEVRRAYRALALQLHPDKQPAGASDAARAEAESRFRELQAAHKILQAAAAERGRHGHADGGGGDGGDGDDDDDDEEEEEEPPPPPPDGGAGAGGAAGGGARDEL